MRDKFFAYATGNDTDWQLELGFKAVKLACPYGSVDGEWGLKENEKLGLGLHIEEAWLTPRNPR